MRRATIQVMARVAFVTVAAGVSGLLVHTPAPAAAKKASEDEQERTFTVRKWAYRRLSKAHEALSAERYGEALELMGEMQDKSGLNDHEQALMWQTRGYIHSAQEQYEDATNSFESCLRLDALPKGAADITKFNLGQLYVARQKFPEAVRVLEAWLEGVEDPTPQALHLIAVAHAQNKTYDKALSYIQRAVAASKNPSESWLQLMLSLHYQLDHNRQVVDVLKTLVERFGKKTYWLQLSAAYQELKQERQALAVLQLAHQQGLLDQHREQLNLAQLYLYHEVPYKAATLLEKGFSDGVLENDAKTLEMLANAWIRAKELDKAVGPLRNAAQLAPTGDLFVQLGRVFLEREDFDQAAGALREGLRKEALTDRPNAELLLGIAAYRGGDLPAAERAFADAKSHDKTRRSAEQWLAVMRNDAKQTAALGRP